MLVQTTFTDVRLINTLERLVQDSVKKVGLSYSGLSVKELEHDRDGHFMMGGTMEVQYKDGVVELNLDIDDVRAMPPVVLKGTIDHEICHCKDLEEKLYGREVFVGENPETNRFYFMATELDKSNSDYFGSKRQIRIFGQDSFDVFHRYKLEEFFSCADTNIRLLEDAKNGMESKDMRELMYLQQCSLVFSLFKEYIKSDLDGYHSPSIKQPIMEVSRRLTRCFDAIRDTDTHWIDKTKMLFYTGIAMNLDVKVLNSYLTDQIIKNNHLEKPTVLDGFARFLLFESDNCYKTLSAIQQTFEIK